MKKKKNAARQQIFVMIAFMLIGMCCGLLMARIIDEAGMFERPLAELVGTVLLLMAGMYVTNYLQLIFHEAGHLVFGLMSGYRFSSFRIMSFMWLKENGKLHLKKLSIAGTGGQCLMIPPEFTDGSIPVMLYNLGGSLMNVLVSVLAFLICIVLPHGVFLPMFFEMLAIVGVAFAAINAFPFSGLANDGWNALSLRKDASAARAFYIQLKVNEQSARGVRLKDMPEEWFVFPEEEQLSNVHHASVGVLACNRLMDEHKFSEANEKMKYLLENENAVEELHRGMLACDRIYCELLTENREEVDILLTKDQKKFMKSMKNYPAVLRTQYVYALFGEKDSNKAEEYKRKFEKCTKKYPYESDLESERELIKIAEKTAGQ